MKKIFHISDIHIRNGDKKICRYDEYISVFDNLFKSIKSNIVKYNLKCDDYVIVVTGDIFHNKNVIGNYGLELYNKFIKGLTDIGKTIMFHGNHDRNQNEKDQPSLISSTIEIDNLMILKHTLSFTINDIGFSYVSIDDTLDNLNTYGRLSNLPKFPEICGNVTKKIALFHGTFANVKLYNGCSVLSSTNPYPFEWISDFDYAMLGDIHLRQKGMYGNTLWGYAGSLVQQNYGEDLINHGYMIWDIQTDTIENINVYNSHGYINIIAENDDIYVRKRGKYDILLNDLVANEYFPENIEIRNYHEFSVENIENLYSILNKNGIKYNTIKNRNSVKKSEERTSNHICVNKETFINYLYKIIPSNYYDKAINIIKNNELLLLNSTDIPDELKNECEKKNKELRLLIKNYYNNIKPSVSNNAFSIEYLEWDNLFCYEGDNKINFANAINNVLLISGNNGTGKSAIYDIITLAIWGNVTKDKQNTLSKTSIINYKYKEARTLVEINVNRNKYQIKRQFNINGKNNIEIYLYDSDKYKLIKKDNACNSFIKTLIGTLEDFLTCSMITQVVDNDILKMDYKESISIIDKASNINEIYELFTLLKNSLNKYKDYSKIIESKKEVYKHITASSNLNIKDKNNIQLELNSLQSKYDSLMIENNRIDIDIENKKYQELASLEFIPMDTLPEDEYAKNVDEFNNIKARVSRVSNVAIGEYAKKYSHDMKYKELVKPCEYNFIKSEEEFLSKYSYIKTDKNIDKLNKEYSKISDNLDKLNKPTIIKKDIRDINYINDDINAIFKCDIGDATKLLEKFVKENNVNVVKKTDIISYECYLKLLELESKLNNNKYINYDNILLNLYKNKEELNVVFKPDKNCDPNINYVSNKFNKLVIEKNEDIMSNLYSDLDKVNVIEIELEKFKEELAKLKNNKDYDYDSKCKYCCNRPWVKRINDLENEIKIKTEEIRNLYDDIYINRGVDYIDIYNKLELAKMEIENAILYKSWDEYSSYIIKKQELDKAINDTISNIEYENKKKLENEKILACIKGDINNFKSNLKILFDELVHYNNNKNDIEYEKLIVEKIHYEKLIEYKNHIEPRINNLIKLKNTYKIWEEQNEINNIIDSYYYIKIKKIIDNNEIAHENNNYYAIKNKILAKRAILQDINEYNGTIKKLANNLSEIKTLEGISNKNIESFNFYQNESMKIKDTIMILEMIINNFNDYKIDLYKNHILKNLVNKTNEYIKLLCHDNTKRFKLDYIISEQKDIIHINWLIHNVTTDNIEQRITINQASGFQKFVISLALRMSLYSNTLCEQIFIDEGFTACDKQNISLVPKFLKNLLNTFDGVIIMTHIDIIKESADIVANINYDNMTKMSNICYNI